MSRAPSSAAGSTGLAEQILGSDALDKIAIVAEQIDEIISAKSGAETAEANAETAETNAELAEASAIAARDASIAARDATIVVRDAAIAARTASEAARDVAIIARDDAQTAKTDADTAKTAAEAAKTAAETAETNAETAANAAQTAKAGAEAALAAATIASGVYAPAFTIGANITTITAAQAFYSRVGNVVTVSIHGIINGGTVAAAMSSFTMSLPIVSNLTEINDLAGSGAMQSNEAIMIVGHIASDRAEFSWIAKGAGGGWFSATFQYEIK